MPDALEISGVFLVSVKLILVAYTSSTSEQLRERLDELRVTLARIDARLISQQPVDFEYVRTER